MTDHRSGPSRMKAFGLALLVLVVCPALSSAQNTVTLPAGTRLMVRTDQTLDSKRSKAGERFSATLEGALVVGAVVAVPQGTKVYGRVKQAKAARRMRGKAVLVLELTDIQMVNGELLPIVSDVFEFGWTVGNQALPRRANGERLFAI